MPKQEDEHSKRISEQEKQEFRDAMHTSANEPPKYKKIKIRGNIPEEPLTSFAFDRTNSSQWQTADAEIFWKRQGITDQLGRKLKQGKLKLSGKCDLHRMTIDQAQNIVENFLQQALANKWRCVIIIPGKGDAHKPVLKNWLLEYLKQNLKVLAIATAVRKHGGSGAVYVLLKMSNSRE